MLEVGFQRKKGKFDVELEAEVCAELLLMNNK